MIWLLLPYNSDAVRGLLGLLHEICEELLNCIKLLRLLRELLLDVWLMHDVLQVHPAVLALVPLLSQLRKCLDLPLPLFGSGSQWLDES